jgi:hypothetical protein
VWYTTVPPSLEKRRKRAEKKTRKSGAMRGIELKKRKKDAVTTVEASTAENQENMYKRYRGASVKRCER